MAHHPADRSAGDCGALLRAVCERPDDDAPRLTYADCLEATGDSDASLRAELIRVQCELARTNPSDNGWEKLQRRSAALDPHDVRWAAELPKLTGIRWNIDLTRGFIWDISCDDEEAFRQNATAIFSSAPIQGVGFRRLRSLAAVLQVPQMSQMRRLILEDFKLRPTDAQALAGASNVGYLTDLHLSSNRLGDAGAIALAGSPHLLRLDNLDLAHNRIGDSGTAALAVSPVVASLSHLGLAGNLLTNVGAMALASSPHLNRLTGLTLWECRKIGAKGKQALQARFDDTVSFDD